MGSEGSWFPESTSVDTRSSRIEWEPVEWADEGAFADADHPEPAPRQRRFFTIAIRRGRVPTSDIASVAILGVDRDLKIGIETRFAAEFDDGEWSLRDHDGIPPSVCQRPREDSAIPEGRKAWFRKVLERAHGNDKDRVTDGAGFDRASRLRADGGETVCGKRNCDRTDTVSYGGVQVRVRCERHALEDVGGIGPASADRLYSEFGSLEEICYASRYRRSTIANLHGFSPDSASTLEERLKSAGIWQDPEDDLTSDGGLREADLIDRAVREAADLVDAGDGLLVAVDYVVDELELEHRRDDVRERVREQTAGDRRIVTDGGRTLDGRDAFLAGEAHRCDICDTTFDTFPELANHDCRPQGGRR